jgi:hypothetical protein
MFTQRKMYFLKCLEFNQPIPEIFHFVSVYKSIISEIFHFVSVYESINSEIFHFIP